MLFSPTVSISVILIKGLEIDNFTDKSSALIRHYYLY